MRVDFKPWLYYSTYRHEHKPSMPSPNCNYAAHEYHETLAKEQPKSQTSCPLDANMDEYDLLVERYLSPS